MRLSWIMPIVAVIGLLGTSGAEAQAPILRQQRPVDVRPTIGQQPVVSPYLNLFGPRNQPGLNYFTLVQPQFQQQAINRQQGIAITDLETSLLEGTSRRGRRNRLPEGVLTTGHPVYFQNYAPFFPALVPQSGP
jgi:hypothetical protein